MAHINIPSRDFINITPEQNKKNIAINRSHLFAAENSVLRNRANAYLARSLVQENQSLIQKNYHSAFMGNRQLANRNTDDIFRNRFAILRGMKAKSLVEQNYKEAMTNKCKIDFLEHRAKLNEKVLDVSLKLAEVNAILIEVNKTIMATNEEIVTFNKTCIDENTNMLKAGVTAEGATPESNSALIKSNAHRIDLLTEKTATNKGKIESVRSEAEKNKTNILENSDLILERREKIRANASLIAANQSVVAKFISESL